MTYYLWLILVIHHRPFQVIVFARTVHHWPPVSSTWYWIPASSAQQLCFSECIRLSRVSQEVPITLICCLMRVGSLGWKWQIIVKNNCIQWKEMSTDIVANDVWSCWTMNQIIWCNHALDKPMYRLTMLMLTCACLTNVDCQTLQLRWQPYWLIMTSNNRAPATDLAVSDSLGELMVQGDGSDSIFGVGLMGWWLLLGEPSTQWSSKTD